MSIPQKSSTSTSTAQSQGKAPGRLLSILRKLRRSSKDSSSSPSAQDAPLTASPTSATFPSPSPSDELPVHPSHPHSPQSLSIHDAGAHSVTVHTIPDIVLDPEAYTTLQKAAAKEKRADSLHRVSSASSSGSPPGTPASVEVMKRKSQISIVEPSPEELERRHSRKSSTHSHSTSFADVVLDNRIYRARSLSPPSSPDVSPRKKTVKLPPSEASS